MSEDKDKKKPTMGEPLKADREPVEDPNRPIRMVDLKEYTKSLLDELLPAMAALTARSQNAPAMGLSEEQKKAVAERSHLCSECGQYVNRCKGNHVQMVVFPTRYPEFAEWFQGRFINGVRYLSNHPGHRITVPADAEGDIKRTMYEFEENERTTRIGRTKTHTSGSVGVEHNPNPVSEAGVGGWR